MKRLQDRLSALEARLQPQESAAFLPAEAERFWAELRRRWERRSDNPPRCWFDWAASAGTWEDAQRRMNVVGNFRVMGILPRFTPENAHDLDLAIAELLSFRSAS